MDNSRKIFSQIYNQYIGKIYRFVFLKVNSQEVAEDLTSETFVKFWDKINSSNSKVENPSAFLYQIARNLVTDHYREKGKTQVVSAELADWYNPIADPREDLAKTAILSSDIGEVKLALASLKEDYQNVIIWHYLDDLSITEVAKLLDRTEPATRVLLHRALESLKKKLNNG